MAKTRILCSGYVTFLLVCFIIVPQYVYPQRTIDSVPEVEFREMGYQGKGDYLTHLARCSKIMNDLKSAGRCKDNSCIIRQPEWKQGNCNRNSQATYFLLFKPEAPGNPLALLSDNFIREYIDDFISSCLEDGQVLSNHYRFNLKKIRNFCECSALEAIKILSIEDDIPTESTLLKIDYLNNLCAFKLINYAN